MRKHGSKEEDSEDDTPEPPFARLYLELPLSMAERYDRKAASSSDPRDISQPPRPFYRYFLDLPFLRNWWRKPQQGPKDR